MWVTNLNDPDGYRVEFESPTDVPEDQTLRLEKIISKTVTLDSANPCKFQNWRGFSVPLLTWR